MIVLVMKPAISFLSSLEVIVEISDRVFLLSSKLPPKLSSYLSRISMESFLTLFTKQPTTKT